MKSTEKKKKKRFAAVTKKAEIWLAFSDYENSVVAFGDERITIRGKYDQVPHFN